MLAKTSHLLPQLPTPYRKARCMKAQSEHHHEVPVWTLNNFSPDEGKKKGKRVWVGTKSNREIELIGVRDTFVRNKANTTISFESRGDGTFQRIKSDHHEVTLREFDNVASVTARAVVNSSRRFRDGGSRTPFLSPEQVELCKRMITVQARRPRESQDRVGLGADSSKLYLELYQKRAEELGQGPFTDEELLEVGRASGLFGGLSQNTRAGFASGDHPILVRGENEFLALLGLLIAVIDPTAADFVIGSHGITMMDTTGGQSSWLPIAPDVAISLTANRGQVKIGVYPQAFVEDHNRAALFASARVTGRSKATIESLLATLN